MNVAASGNTTSGVEVVNISPHGFWLLLAGEQLFLPFESFPWFRDATVAQISHVLMQSASHLYWPALDIDLSVDSIRKPEDFPLVSSPI